MKTKMKIAVISSMVFPVPPPGYSGLEQLAWQQAEGLARLGHDVTLIAPKGSRCDHAKLLMPCDPGQWDEKTAYGTYWQELFQFDVIIDNSWAKWPYILKAEGRLKAPVLGIMHAPVNTMWSSHPPVDKACIVCISQDQANHYKALYEHHAEVCYNGVDPDFYKPVLGIRRTNRFLFLARFSTIKGPDLAIRACNDAGTQLDLIGDTSITNEPEYLQHCKQMTDGSRVRFVGPASRGECAIWFTQAHVLLHPNERYREPFGLAPVEAQLCGCPVIGWNRGALPETVRHGETGWIVNSFEELVSAINMCRNEVHTLSDSTWLDDKVRTRCREWAMTFSVDRMIARYEELCQRAIDEPW